MNPEDGWTPVLGTITTALSRTTACINKIGAVCSGPVILKRLHFKSPLPALTTIAFVQGVADP